MVTQRGVALITALLVVALATSAAVAMVAAQQLDIRRTGNVLYAEQADLYVLGVEAWAGRVLRQDAMQSDYDHAGERWATRLPPIPVEGGEVSGYIEEMQGRFNLNSLLRDGQVDASALVRFRRLLEALELETAIADALADWLDPDLEVRFPDGAEDGHYLGMSPGYRSANAPLVSVSELMLLPGVTTDVMEKLEPFVVAMPADATLNVNFAPVEVLMSLSSDIDRLTAEQLVEARGDEGYASVEDFTAQPLLEGKLLPVETLGVKSRYFMVKSMVRYGRINAGYQSMIERSDGFSRTVMRAQGAL